MLRPPSFLLVFTLASFGWAGCSVLRPRSTLQPEPLPPLTTKTLELEDAEGVKRTIPLVSLTDHFLTLASRAQDNERRAVNEFVAVGLNLSDEIVEQWFRIQLADEAGSRRLQHAANLAAGAGTALLGIMEASSKTVAIFGTGVTGVNGLWRADDSRYLLSTALPVVIRKLRDYRTEQREWILANLGVRDLSYSDAVAILRSYHQTASRETIQRFLQQSSELAVFAAKDEDLPDVDRAQVRTYSSLVYLLLNNDAPGYYSEKDLVVIYAYLVEPPGSVVRDALRSTLINQQLASRVERLGEQGRDTLVLRMTTLDRLLGLEKRVEDLRRAATTAMAADEAARLDATTRARVHQASAALQSLLGDDQTRLYSLEQLAEIYALVTEPDESPFLRSLLADPAVRDLDRRIDEVLQQPEQAAELRNLVEILDQHLGLQSTVGLLRDVRTGLTRLPGRESQTLDRPLDAGVTEAVLRALDRPPGRSLLSRWEIAPLER